MNDLVLFWQFQTRRTRPAWIEDECQTSNKKVYVGTGRAGRSGPIPYVERSARLTLIRALSSPIFTFSLCTKYIG